MNELIQRYLKAETTLEEERELATANPTLARLSKALEMEPLPEAEDAFDRIIRQARWRKVRTWGLAASGVAAILLAVVLLTRKPENSDPEGTDSLEMLQQLQFIFSLDPADAASYQFKPVGDGYIMTAQFADGDSVSYLFTPMNDGKSFQLIALNP